MALLIAVSLPSVTIVFEVPAPASDLRKQGTFIYAASEALMSQ